MQSVATYQTWPQARAISPPNSGVIAYARALTMSAWFLSLLVHLWWLRDWAAFEDLYSSGLNTKQFYFYGFGAAVVGHLTLGIFAWLTVPFVIVDCWSGRLFTLYFILMGLTSPLSVIPYESAKYVVATYGVFALCTLFWVSNYYVLQRVLVFTGFAILAWIYLLMFKHGLTHGFGSHIGGINRNVTAGPTVGAMILCQLSPKKALRWTAVALAIALSAAVSSRGSLVAAATFLIVYYAIHKGTIRAAVHALAVAALFGVVLLASTAIRDILVNDVMKLHDRARGLGSGFTGRVDMWKDALEAFWTRPILGYGFRTSTMGTNVKFGGVHSGYLRVFLESGFVGGFLILSAIVVEAIRRLRLALRLRALSPPNLPGINLIESTRINSVACATLAMTLALWVYEQHYINIGSVFSLVMFLMLTSPVSITDEGITRRQ